MKNFALDDLDILLSPEELLRQILGLAIEQVGGTSGSLMLLNPNTGALDIEVARGLDESARKAKLKLGEGITGHVATSGKARRVDDVSKDRFYVELNSDVRAELAVPLMLDDQVIGVLNVDNTKVGAFSSAHEQELRDFSVQASGWIRLAWEINQLRSRGEQLETLVDMGQIIISQNELDEVLQRVAHDGVRLMRARLCSIMLLSEDGEELQLKAWAGASAAYITRPHLRVAESLVGVVVRRQRPLTVLNVQENQHYQQTELARQEGLVSLLAVPLVVQGRSMGVLTVYTDQLHRFSNEETRLLNAMAGLSAVAIAKAQHLESIVEAEERLKASERLSALGWLAAEIAHEIRNPLTVVQMLFHTLVEDLDLDETGSKDVQLIEKRLKHMDKILDQILTFAKSAEPELEPLDAEELLEDLSLLVRLKLNEQRIELDRIIEGQRLTFFGDKAQVEQAILNLVLNACQVMGPGGLLTLRAKAGSLEGRLTTIISVTDTGKGLSEAEKSKLFEPFLSGRRGGTGLGLALVKKTMEGHGGAVKVSSVPGEGTTFELHFPVERG